MYPKIDPASYTEHVRQLKMHAARLVAAIEDQVPEQWELISDLEPLWPGTRALLGLNPVIDDVLGAYDALQKDLGIPGNEGARHESFLHGSHPRR